MKKPSEIRVEIRRVECSVAEGPEEGEKIPGLCDVEFVATRIDGLTYEDMLRLVGVEFVLVPRDAGRRF